ncbi:PIN domain-containing protein [Crossiella sp. CA-258035]|uniref:PIN domain-containing protein n=1 Tax=Crossiella sp. CA-258035 TaxID=2981138 RepID=UPI0024BBFFF6|nr:PIN domain-containing protein [Crossiella sp. CA-258035]WHT18091.1 PIN domain-containing protein [Crossiella sp. CA-258035]
MLYPSTLRDLLIRIARAGLVQAKWTNRILDEVFDNLREHRPDLDPDALTRTRRLMVCAVRDCLVTNYEPLEAALELPDPDDRHVLAAAIKARAQVIVTNNLRDFPSGHDGRWDIEAKSADDFATHRDPLAHDHNGQDPVRLQPTLRTSSANTRAGQGSKRYPMPGSVSRCRGCAGSGSSLRRSWARYTRR